MASYRWLALIILLISSYLCKAGTFISSSYVDSVDFAIALRRSVISRLRTFGGARIDILLIIGHSPILRLACVAPLISRSSIHFSASISGDSSVGRSPASRACSCRSARFVVNHRHQYVHQSFGGHLIHANGPRGICLHFAHSWRQWRTPQAALAMTLHFWLLKMRLPRLHVYEI